MSLKLMVRGLVLALVALALYGVTRYLFQKWSQVDFDVVPTDVASQPTKPMTNGEDEKTQQGYAWAQQNQVTEHSRCKAKTKGSAYAGCSKYVTEQKKFPPQPLSYAGFATTGDCIAALDAFYNAYFQDQREQGHQPRFYRYERQLYESCQNIDNTRILRVIYEPQARLNALLDKAIKGITLSQDDIETIRMDYPTVVGFRPDPKRDQYIASAEQLFKLVGGKSLVFPLAQATTQAGAQVCAGFEQDIKQRKATAEQTGEQLAKLNALNDENSQQQRQQWQAVQDKSINEWSELSMQSKAAGCYKPKP